jgi:type I restriction enzyme S subunit
MQELVTGKKRLPGFQPVNLARQETEIGKLPTDWDVVDVGEVTLRHKQGFYTKDRYVDSGTRLVRITDLMGNAVDFSSMPMLKMSQPEFEHFQICGGDFLFARSGAIGRYGIIHDQIDAVFGSYIIRFVFDRHKISNEYLGYLYQTSLVSKQLLSITQGSSNININAENIKALRIPLPTANEQDAIATILLQMDAEIAALEAKLDKARQLKQGMMHNLLTGKIRLV